MRKNNLTSHFGDDDDGCRSRILYVGDDDDGFPCRMSHVGNGDDGCRCRVSYVNNGKTGCIIFASISSLLKKEILKLQFEIAILL